MHALNEPQTNILLDIVSNWFDYFEQVWGVKHLTLHY